MPDLPGHKNPEPAVAARVSRWRLLTLLSRTYTDQADGTWTDFPSMYPEPFFATCGYCGWDGPCRDTRAEAERDRWRHPNLLCWLRALWIDYCSPRWGRRWRRA